ncbi:MAG: putative alpha/beta hydrolase family esterase [Planctomycetota bacterium]|jgi:predicted alpha/beta hydrolase family esterase
MDSNLTIIFVPGNQTSRTHKGNETTKLWLGALQTKFPHAHVQIINTPYDMWSKSDVELLIKSIKDTVSEYQNVILVGYSFGGLAIRITADTLDDASHIKALVSIGTPHRRLNLKQRRFVESFGLKHAVSKPILAIGGWFDIFAAPFFLKPTTKEKYVVKILPYTHRALFFSSRARKGIIKHLTNLLKLLSL